MTRPPARPYVCLSMIVRNESAVIERCLRSALPVIDAAVICDTGSSDDTPARVSAFMDAAGVPAFVCTHAWQDFGANRTAAIREAEAAVSGPLGWPLDHTYWLFLDADLELVVCPGFSRDAIQGDAVAIRQQTAELSYWNLRLARASLYWSAVGRTHERYVCAADPRRERLTNLWIRDHADGGSRSAKFTRDIAWLSAQLAETPDDLRSLFYLAQSYLGSGDLMKALLLYRRRAAIADGTEEAWYAKLSAGMILAAADQFEAASAALLDARTADPGRAEPLYELARLYRRHGRAAEALAFAEAGASLPLPDDDRVAAVHRDVYDYKVELELALAAVGTPRADRGQTASERVIRSRAVPPDALEEARLVSVQYAAPITGMDFLPIRPALAPPYRPCNPSILRTGHGYLINCRAVNYEQRRLNYRSLDDDGVYRTRNVLMAFDTSFAVVDEREVVFDEPSVRTARVQGLEDCRLVAAGGTVWLTCATADRHPSGRVHQSLCQLDARGRVVRHQPVIGPFDDRHQKNWLPFADEAGALHAIYGYDPLRVVSLDPDAGTYRVALERESPVNAAHWRGSAGPLTWPDDTRRRLVLVHEVVNRQGPDAAWERVYLHRFVEYDDAWGLTRMSRPFVFAHKGVEFACGMTPAVGDRDLVVAFGLEDREAYVGRVAFSRVDALLEGGRV